MKIDVDIDTKEAIEFLKNNENALRALIEHLRDCELWDVLCVEVEEINRLIKI